MRVMRGTGCSPVATRVLKRITSIIMAILVAISIVIGIVIVPETAVIFPAKQQ